jgi:hypothetical protein
MTDAVIWTAAPVYGPSEPLREYRLPGGEVLTRNEAEDICQHPLSNGWQERNRRIIIALLGHLDREHAAKSQVVTGYVVTGSNGDRITLTVEEAKSWMQPWTYQPWHRAIAQALRAAGVTP